MAYQIAAYLRLSMADADIDKTEKEESNSIQNQRKLIQHYLKTTQEFTTGEHQDYDYHEYVDDGISGTTTKYRPSFLHMIKDTERHRINCIIVKDFSRFSREALVLGDYIEQIFPMKGIRFISINDHYDSILGNSAGSASLLSVSMKALVNEYYVKDISRKRKASTHSRLSQGAALGATPYGYRRNANHNFEIDPDSSPAVIRIFDLALEGKRMADICRIMTEERYLTPLAYGNLYPDRGNIRRAATIKADFWSADTVRNILHNPAYLGTLVSGKTRNIAPNSHIRVPTDQNDWYVTEEIFPPLISKETFNRVQELYPFKKRKTSTTSTSVNVPQEPKCNTLYPRRTILLGHLKCGYCGKSMNINRYGSRCLCTHARYNIKELCSAKSHKISDIEAALLPQIKERSSQILLYEKEMQEIYREKKQEVKNMSYRVALLEKELDKLLNQKQSNYETFIQGDLVISKFQMLDRSMRTQIKDKRQALQELKDQMEHCRSFSISTDLLRIAETIVDYPNAEVLTEEMVDVLVNYIIVKNDTPYEIHWKYDEKGVTIDESKN